MSNCCFKEEKECKWYGLPWAFYFENIQWPFKTLQNIMLTWRSAFWLRLPGTPQYPCCSPVLCLHGASQWRRWCPALWWRHKRVRFTDWYSILCFVLMINGNWKLLHGIEEDAVKQMVILLVVCLDFTMTIRTYQSYGPVSKCLEVWS